MRLLSTDTTETLQLRQYSSDISKYAILSHTWEENKEVAFEELGTLAAKEKRGFQKIKQFCRRAAKDGYEYVWVDTCCIDKRSSSELSEALNSMYEWYKNADMCYAYLRDVNDRDPTHRESQLTASKWFTRGWTLQELVAPEHVHFFGEDAEGWFPIGTKVGLQQVISRITKIDASASIAQRMSWASGRKTTRKEDIAYCLLGIFNLNMPLLYGEGDKAFTRLQLELLNVPNDHTLFAWGHAGPAVSSLRTSAGTLGLLAPSVEDFSNCGDIVPSQEISSSSHYMTNIGLSEALENITDFWIAIKNPPITPMIVRRGSAFH
ncbi:Heterokaryon incompatibility protein (HET) domain containing protein [Hyaloscypha variabilis]